MTAPAVELLAAARRAGVVIDRDPDGCDPTRPAPYCGHCPPTAGRHDQAGMVRRAA